MKYTVLWRVSAEAELAHIWNSSVDRQAVTAASNAIDRALRFDPVLRGETVRGTIRVIVERPLVVTYRVDEDDRIVRVIGVAYVPGSSLLN
jgi:hypothetical protein